MFGIERTRSFPLVDQTSTQDRASASFDVPFSLAGIPVTNAFVGRSSDLDFLGCSLDPDNALDQRQICVVYGLGGLGKTQLAVKYIRTVKARYSAIFWLDGTTEASLLNSFVSAVLRIPGFVIAAEGSIDGEAASQQLLHWLARPGNERWLLVFDNIDKTSYNAPDGDEDSAAAYDISRYLPECDCGSILVTTRLARLESLGESLPLGRLDESESLFLMEKHSRKKLATTDEAEMKGKL